MSSIEWLDQCPSTNTELSSRADLPHGYCIAARTQTAGRGQRGNTWEAEPGKNLTFSLLLRPDGLEARRQFELSMAVSLAIVDTLEAYGIDARIKWPNDIYVGLKKLAGILIENRLSGSMIDRAIVGVGLNVNQEVFRSDAPNPVSMKQLTGRQYALDELLNALVKNIAEFPALDAAELKARYWDKLLFTDGTYPFAEPGGEIFQASITDVGLDGILSLSNGRSYAFKEVAWVP